MSRLRPLVRADLPAIGELYDRVHPGDDDAKRRARRAYFARIFFEHPWRDDELPSWVAEDDGGIHGMIGVMPRRMVFQGRPIRVVVGNHLLVDEGKRASLAGVQLLRALLNGPQDLAIAEGNDITKRLWTGIGGTYCPGWSLSFRWPLAPIGYFTQRFPLASRFGIARSAIGLADGLLTRIPRSPFLRRVPATRAEPLDARGLATCVREGTAGLALHPQEEPESLAWVLDIVREKSVSGELRVRRVIGPDRGQAGWYVYMAKPGGTARLLQIGASAGCGDDVLRHLGHEAATEGSVAIAGRLVPAWMPPMLALPMRVAVDGGWMLAHARDPEIVAAIQRGDAFISRLEGEWWIPFRAGSYTA